MFDEELEVIPKTALQIFNETFLSYYELLKNRIEKLRVLSKGTLDYKTYFDASLVQIRAMCIEDGKRKNNHTIQNFLRLNGFEKEVADVNNLFDTVMSDGSILELTLREAIKVTTDKFIAHYDTMTGATSDDLEFEYNTKRAFYRYICETDLTRDTSGICLYDIMQLLDSKVNMVLIVTKVESNGFAGYMLL